MADNIKYINLIAVDNSVQSNYIYKESIPDNENETGYYQSVQNTLRTVYCSQCIMEG